MTTPADRAILHVDMDAFFASVEQRDQPELRGKPVAVGGDGRRGVVAAASYEARRFGVHSAMPSAAAKRACPDLIFVRGRHSHYGEVSRQIFTILETFTPMVQPISIDEAFLDVTGSRRLFGSPAEIARQIRERIQLELNLTASVGVAPNKFLAKLASDLEKPDGLTVIEEAELPHRLALLPVERIWGVGPAMASRLHGLGVRTFGDLQQLNESQALAMIGSSGPHLRKLSLGLDSRPVHRDTDARSIGIEQTFGVNHQHAEAVRGVLISQCEHVAHRVRRHERFGRTITVKIRFDDFQTITRSNTLATPTDETEQIVEAACGLFDTWVRSSFRPVRLIGVSVTHFDSGAGRQMDLFTADDPERNQRLDRATDRIEERYGNGTISRGRWRRRDAGTSRRE